MSFLSSSALSFSSLSLLPSFSYASIISLRMSLILSREIALPSDVVPPLLEKNVLSGNIPKSVSMYFDDVILEIEKNPTIHRDTKFIGKKPAATPTSIPTIITSDSSKPKNDGLKIVF